MKKALRIGLRLLGVGLVVFVFTRIELGDTLEWPDGRVEPGTIVAQTTEVVVFQVEGAGTPREIALTGTGAPTLQQGVVTIVRNADQSLLLLALAIFGPVTLISISRWWLLLKAIQLPITFAESLRLSYIGFFFNAVVPGLTGGDVVKAVYIARGSHAPYRAFLSVFVDRAIGLFGLALLAGVVVSMHWGQEGFRQVSVVVYACLGGGVLTGCILFSRRLRRWLRVEQILARLPFGRVLTEIDQAITSYRNAPGTVGVAILMSIANHVCLVGMAILIGRALGIHNPMSHFFAIVPVCLMAASVPLMPGGWGMREGAFAYFFGQVGVAASMSIPVSVLLGLGQLAWFMLGGLVFIARPDRVSARDLEAFNAEIQAAATAKEDP